MIMASFDLPKLKAEIFINLLEHKKFTLNDILDAVKQDGVYDDIDALQHLQVKCETCLAEYPSKKAIVKFAILLTS